jgi:hypothetical protein
VRNWTLAVLHPLPAYFLFWTLAAAGKGPVTLGPRDAETFLRKLRIEFFRNLLWRYDGIGRVCTMCDRSHIEYL